MDETAIPENVLRQILAEQRVDEAADATTSRLQARVFGDAKTRNRAMRWACRAGCLPAIDAAVRHGSSLSAVPVGSVAGRAVALVGGPAATRTSVVVKALTLQLAAKSGQTEAFGHLISLGARLNEPGTSVASIRALIRLATQGPDAPALLRLLLSGAGGASAKLVRQLDQELRDEALLELMRGCSGNRLSRGPSPDEYLGFARALLDAGAGPNRCCLDGEGTSMSTLSFAVLSQSPDLVRLLLDHGAHVEGFTGTKLPRRPRLPLHVPLCAAVHAIARSTALDEVSHDAAAQITQLLLDRGANINSCVLFKESAFHTDRLTTPLLIFLRAVKSWDAGQGGPEALHGLRFLLDRGASPVAPPTETTPGLYERVDQRRCNWCAPDADVFRNLLDDWGVHALQQSSFTSALEILLNHPCRHREVRTMAETLATYDYTTPHCSASEDATQERVGIIEGWRAVLGSVIRPLAQSERSDFLYFYIVSKGTCPEHWARLRSHRSRDHQIGELARATVALLLEAKADVNHRLRRLQPGDQERENDPTALHSICVWLAGRGFGENSHEDMYGRFHPKCGGLRHTPQRLELVRFLIEKCGADAGATYEGRTPADILEQLSRPDLDEEEADPWKRDLEVVRQARGRFVELLRGAAAAAESQ